MRNLLGAIADGLTLRPRAETIVAQGTLTDTNLIRGVNTAVGGWNYSGEVVDVKRSLQLSAAWACGRLISETGGTLPCGLYRERATGTKELAKSEDLYYLLHTQPNQYMTAATMWQCVLFSLLFWGNAYLEVRLGPRGNIVAIDFLVPCFVTWEIQGNGSVRWQYNDPWTGKLRDIPEDRIWHIPGLSMDGRWGMSPIRYGANVLGNAIAASRASGTTFKNGLKSPGLVTMDHVLKKDQRNEIRKHVADVAASGGWMVLEKGADLKQLTMNPQDAELLLTLNFGVEEVCRWFGVPPFMVGHGDKQTSWGTGIEQQMIWFVTSVLRPWCVKIEQSAKRALFRGRRDLSIEFRIEGLLRGDSAARQAFYSAMVNNGIMSRDECRLLENLEPMGGNAGVLMAQTAMAPIDSLGQIPDDSARARAALMAWLSGAEPVKE